METTTGMANYTFFGASQPIPRVLVRDSTIQPTALLPSVALEVLDFFLAFMDRERPKATDKLRGQKDATHMLNGFMNSIEYQLALDPETDCNAISYSSGQIELATASSHLS